MLRYDYKTLLLENEKGVMTLTLNVPEALNAMTVEMVAELRDAVEKLVADGDVRVVVVTGAGKHFCAGGNIKMLRERYVDGGESMSVDGPLRTGMLMKEIKTCPKPFIALVNGAAMGGGTGLALACDFRFVEPRSKIGMAFINLGLSGDSSVLYMLSRIIPPAKALELMMTGAIVDGTEAGRLGMATLCEEGEARGRAYALAEKLGGMATASLGRQKLLAMEFFYPDYNSYSFREAEFMKASSKSEDFKEGILSFIEKRPAAFKGR